MNYSEDDLILLSALQHYIFCPRQCALIHVEQIWSENLLTAEGRIMHERVHEEGSHVVLQVETPQHHRISIPDHDALRVGTLNAICRQWDIGLDHCAKALERAPAGSKPKLQKEIDVALMTGVMLKATRNLARFQLERERAIGGGLSPRGVRDSRRRLERIVKHDLANSRLGLDLAERNYRYGYGYVYGKHFDADLIRAKIDFTNRVVLPDIANAEPSAIE